MVLPVFPWWVCIKRRSRERELSRQYFDLCTHCIALLARKTKLRNIGLLVFLSSPPFLHWCLGHKLMNSTDNLVLWAGAQHPWRGGEVDFQHWNPLPSKIERPLPQVGTKQRPVVGTTFPEPRWRDFIRKGERRSPTKWVWSGLDGEWQGHWRLVTETRVSD